MKTIEIIGDNYFGKWTGSHTSCRAVIIKDNNLLLSYETKTDQWMLPGGGLEEGESEKECVIREITEETGYITRPSECLLEIDEYYEDQKFVNRYFSGEITGTACQHLTEREKEAGMEPRWLPLDDILLIFSKHSDYTDTDEMRRGMYLREYTALREITGNAGTAL
ncbi:MAG: NUDIX domain-containing protein [Ruminiclostridium sp.]|nr:NUDIX domain-containing protein [Ruminiclostridium sp.]